MASKLAPVDRSRLTDLIEYDDDIASGVPHIKRNKLPITCILDDMASDITVGEIEKKYKISLDEIRGCLLEASNLANHHKWKSHGFHLPKDYYTNPEYMEDPSDEDWENWYAICDEREEEERSKWYIP